MWRRWERQNSVKQASSKFLGSHVLHRLASARRGAAAAVQAKRGDSCSAERVEAGPISSIRFGMKAEHPTLPRRDDVLVDIGAAAPKPCHSPVEMRTLTAAGGLLHAGKAFTTTRSTFYQPRLRFCPTGERTSTQYAPYYSSFWRINNQLGAPFRRRVIQTKFKKNSGIRSGRFYRSSPRLPVL